MKNNFSYSDLPSYVTIIHVNAHLNSLQSMTINTRNKSTKKTAVDDPDEPWKSFWMDVFWDMADKSA